MRQVLRRQFKIFGRFFMELRKGQKIPLNENLLTIKFERQAGVLEIDTAAFMQGGDGKTAEEDFVFYGNPRHSSGCVVHLEDDSLKIDLSKIPPRIEKISFTATIYDAEKRKHNFSKISGAVLKIFSTQTKSQLANFPLENFYRETAIVLGEIYRYKGSWKFNAVGAGFNGGLAALCNNFGIEVIEETPPPEPAPPKVVIPPPPKFTELKRGQSYRLATKNGRLGEISVNLTWTSPPNKKIDLDLCCLYELEDEFVGAVQARRGTGFGKFFWQSGRRTLHQIESRRSLRQNSRRNSQNQRQIFKIHQARFGLRNDLFRHGTLGRRSSCCQNKIAGRRRYYYKS